jgi:hypothetical protein
MIGFDVTMVNSAKVEAQVLVINYFTGTLLKDLESFMKGEAVYGLFSAPL